MKSVDTLDQFLNQAAADNRLYPTHISLFIAIFYHSHAGLPFTKFQVTRRKLMIFSRIKSKATYHKCLRELVAFGYISYQPSFDPYKASLVTMLSEWDTAEIIKQ